jgi:hypothetical protein
MKHGSRQRRLEGLIRENEELKRQLADARSMGNGLQRTLTALLDWYASHIDGLFIVSGQVVGIIQAKAMSAWERPNE